MSESSTEKGTEALLSLDPSDYAAQVIVTFPDDLSRAIMKFSQAAGVDPGTFVIRLFGAVLADIIATSTIPDEQLTLILPS